MTRLHADGMACLEGSRRVPRGFRPCCEGFAQRVVACTSDIRYEWWTRLKTWVIVIDEAAGGGGVAFAHCPHCGQKLPSKEHAGRWLDLSREGRRRAADANRVLASR